MPANAAMLMHERKSTSSFTLAIELVRRDITARYLSTFSGWLWLIAQPVCQLLIYGYVFLQVFRARLPEAEFGQIGFLPFLAIGLWPWNAFTEALGRATAIIPESAGLLGKIAMPRHLLVVAPVIAGFIAHALGFIAVLVVLWAGGWLEWPGWSVLVVPVLFVLLMLFALGLGWLFAAINVFVRDVAQMLPQALTLLFFLTPILYPRSLVPENLHVLADVNPLALFVGLFRHCLLGTGDYGIASYGAAAVIAGFTAWFGYAVFRRLGPHFEDFL
jgi:lipopolysaccharide transport system permease protein